jgi:two-component system LytT family response regulator
MTVRAFLVDDEAPARRRLRRLLGAHPDIAIAGEYGDGASALNAIRAQRPDLVFLDVQMPALGGFDVVAALSAHELPAILFVTAFDRYALRAFDVHAVDYLLKPFTAERFRTAVARACERIAARRADPAVARLADALRTRPAYLSRLLVRSGPRTVVVDVRAIDWLEAADNYVRLHVGRREFLARETLSALEAQLDPDQVVRIHRSAMVQVDRVAEMRAATHGDAEIVLRDGTRLAVSRTWREGLQRAIGALRFPKDAGARR